MKSYLLALLMLPLVVSANAPQTDVPNPVVISMDDEITIYMVGDLATVNGPNKVRIEIFDEAWHLLITENNCSPITVYVDLAAYPDGIYNVKVTTTTDYVTQAVTKE